MGRIIKLTESDLEKIVSKVIEEQVLDKIKQKISNVVDYFTDESSGCSSDTLKASNWKSLYTELVQKKMIKNGEPLLILWGPNQELHYTKDGRTESINYSVSTGANGFGNTKDNKKTPIGLMKVTKKVKGKDYEVLVAKTPTGKILGPNIDSTRVDEKGNKHRAEVVTGLLELSGLEQCNSNVLSRNIYFHGTNKESSLGTPRSNGCIRTSTNAINKLINTVPVGTKVYIFP
jgi:lipoprotein-anchoring transpeptidase ErfK/SrfK